MNTTLKEQIEAIQVAMNSLQKINDGVFLLSVNHELVSKVLPALNDAGSSLAALHMSDPYKEIERLTDWKESMLKLWGPVIDWMQNKSNLGLGKDISVEVLKRVQEYESLKQQLKEANDIIAHYADVNHNQ